MWLICVLLLLFPLRAYSYFDPFLNPIKLKEEQLKNSIEKSRKKIEVKGLSLFTPVIPKPLEDLSIQGVVSSGNTRYLVLLDPSTGETFLLREGDAISKNEKIVKITPTEVVIAVFKQKNGKVVKSYRRLKLNREGQ